MYSFSIIRTFFPGCPLPKREGINLKTYCQAGFQTNIPTGFGQDVLVVIAKPK
jgi:hypothetical protein